MIKANLFWVGEGTMCNVYVRFSQISYYLLFLVSCLRCLKHTGTGTVLFEKNVKFRKNFI